MDIEILEQEFSVCSLNELPPTDDFGTFFFIGKTDEEISLVCDTSKVPENAMQCENGWRAFRVAGVLDFSLTGILSGLSALLAENKIGLFAVSTYNTDYILTKAENFGRAIAVLRNNGYGVR